METRYTNVIEDNTATMLLYGEIGYEVNGGYFTQEMQYHNSMGRKIKVYINSPGGSVFDGYAIAQAIMDYEADTHVVGLAASMAGIILQFGKYRTANDFAVGMIHLPSAKGKGNDKLLGIVKESLLNILEGRCQKPRNEIEAMMEEETFMDSDEMLDLGFVDEIVTTSSLPVNVSYDDLKSKSVTELYSIYNKLILNTEMKKIKNHFELPENATEDNILESVVELEHRVTDLKDELSVANTEKDKAIEDLTSLKTEHDSLIEEVANLIVDSAVNDGKIEKDKKSVWVEAAKKDPKGVKAQLETIAGRTVIDSVSTTVINKSAKDNEDSKEENIIDWVRNNGPELQRLLDEDPEKLDRIMDKYNNALQGIK